MDESIAKVVSRLRHTRSAVGNAIETNETSRPTGRWPRWRARTERALLAKVLGRINDDLLWLEVKYSNLTASAVAGDVETPASRERAAKTAASQSVPDKLQIERLHELLPKICNAVIGGTDDRPAGVAATGKAPAGEAPSEEYLWSLEGNLRYELESLAGLAYLRSKFAEQVQQNNPEPRDFIDDLRRELSKANGQWLGLEDAACHRQLAVAHHFRHRRAAAARRRELLSWCAVLLGILVPAFGALAALQSSDDTDTQVLYILLAAVAGAFGGSLSLMRTLRDQAERLAEMDAIWAALLAQVMAAAGLGVLAVVLYDANILPDVGGQTVSQNNLVGIAYAFLAGFSEPFAIQAVSRLAGKP